jgi:surface antigen
MGGLVVPTQPAEQTLCSGYAHCRTAGYGDFGYGRARRNSWWQMGSGSNCTNFVAYRLVRAGMPNRRPVPDPGRDASSLNAYRWGVVYASRTDSHPNAGAVAWWNRSRGGSWGHVAFVEAVNPDGTVTISEDSSTGRGFDWKRIGPGRDWPTGFIHFRLLGSPTKPGRVRSRDHAAGSVTLWAGPAAQPVATRDDADPAEPC